MFVIHGALSQNGCGGWVSGAGVDVVAVCPLMAGGLWAGTGRCLRPAIAKGSGGRARAMALAEGAGDSVWFAALG